jgi:hypothetical protein
VDQIKEVVMTLNSDMSARERPSMPLVPDFAFHERLANLPVMKCQTGEDGRSI